MTKAPTRLTAKLFYWVVIHIRLLINTGEDVIHLRKTIVHGYEVYLEILDRTLSN